MDNYVITGPKKVNGKKRGKKSALNEKMRLILHALYSLRNNSKRRHFTLNEINKYLSKNSFDQEDNVIKINKTHIIACLNENFIESL